jgi:transposase
MKKKRQRHSNAFKARVAIEAIQERESVATISQKYAVHPAQVNKWKKEFLARAPQIFEQEVSHSVEEIDVDTLYAKIGQLEMERDFLKKSLSKLGL